MKLPLTLSFYIIRQFLWSFLVVFSVFAVLIILMDAVELLRKSSGKDIPFYILLEMVILKFPMLIQVILPFIVLVSSVLTYTSMARKQELVIIRSAGVSAWEFLMPSVISAFVIGLFVIMIFNPIACKMLSRFELFEAKYFYNKQNLLEISDQGLWVKQEIIDVEEEATAINEEPAVTVANVGDAANINANDVAIGKAVEQKPHNIIIHAEKVSGEDDVNLEEVTVFAFFKDDMFLYRIDSENATLKNGNWSFVEAVKTSRDGESKKVNNYLIPTNVKIGDIQKSFADPQTISFWELPNFISKLSRSGFSEVAHVVHYHKLLSFPLFYAVMVIIGAVFSLKAPRQGKVGYAISFSIILGFVIYFISNLVMSLGLSGALPVLVASWSPIVIMGFFGFLILLHFEDG